MRLLALLLGLGLPVAGVAHASPTLYVQIIDVCDDNGSNCALSNPAAQAGVSYNPTAIQDVFAQAGIAVSVLAPVQFNSAAYLNPAVIDDPAHGYLTGSPTDPAHQLLDLPGHDQNTNSNVLNVFVVNSLPHTTSINGVPTPAGTLYGLGLINSNGAVVTTGINYVGSVGYVAPLDNIAHELGHNLGLMHTDQPPLAGTPIDTPYNLMDSLGRNAPRTLCGITGVSCDLNSNVVPTGSPSTATIGVKDVLQPSQIAQVQSSAANLFTVDLADVTSDFTSRQNSDRPGVYSCGSYVAQQPLITSSCGGTISFAASSSPGVLDDVRIRFANASLLEFGRVDSFGGLPGDGNGCAATTATTSLAAGGVELVATFVPGCFVAGVTDAFDIADSYTDLTPFSIEYDFADGVTSTAAFDQSGSDYIASSMNPIALGNLNTPDQDGPALDVPTDPAQFNAVSVVDGDDGTPYVPNSAPDGTPVPEPGTAGLLVSGLLALMASGRREG